LKNNENTPLVEGPRRLRSYLGPYMSKKVQSFLSHMAHRAALISVFLALSQTPAYTARPWIWGLVHRAACLFTSQLSLALSAPTHVGMARLS